MSKAKSAVSVVKYPNVIKLEEARTQLKEVRQVVKSLTNRTKFLARIVKDERTSNKMARLTKMETRKAETIAKLKAKLAALEAA